MTTRPTISRATSRISSTSTADLQRQAGLGVGDRPSELHGITRPVTLHAEYLGYTPDPWGGHRAVFTAAGTVDREDWGLTWNLPLDGGGLVVSKEIRIEIELEAVLQP